MNSKEKILSILETLVTKIDTLEARQANLEAGQTKLETKISDIDRKVDAIWEQTAHLAEFEAESRQSFEKINAIIKVQYIRYNTAYGKSDLAESPPSTQGTFRQAFKAFHFQNPL
ncbi:MAG: hypothetical protein LBU32_24010 [Clostridiales bacterium]|jgi:chromosome segregation ATPase|nr:hypothetical protein [Clostridiales bacterium]